MCILPITHSPFICTQVKTLGGESSQKDQEVADLQARIQQEEQKEQQSRRESLELRQRITESEAEREAARREVCITMRHWDEIHQN